MQGSAYQIVSWKDRERERVSLQLRKCTLLVVPRVVMKMKLKEENR